MPLERISGKCYPRCESAPNIERVGNEGDAPFCCLAALSLAADAGTEQIMVLSELLCLAVFIPNQTTVFTLTFFFFFTYR